MHVQWLRFPIYLNGQQRFDANPTGDLLVADAYARMDFVFENIEFCFAEGRMMDVEIFSDLENLAEQIRQDQEPCFDEIQDLVNKVAERYAFGEPPANESVWLRQDQAGQVMIWIDRDKLVAESNKRLFG